MFQKNWGSRALRKRDRSIKVKGDALGLGDEVKLETLQWRVLRGCLTGGGVEL